MPEPQVFSADECPAVVFAGFYIDSYVMNLLRLFYKERPLEKYPGCRHLVYTPGIREGEDADIPGSLRIEMWSQWNPSRTGGAPTIAVRRGDMGSVRIGIADKHPVSSLNGESQHTRVWTGSLAVWCISRVERECSMLALQTADYLQGFSNQIADKLEIQRFEVRSVSSNKPLREHPSFLASAVLIEYGFYLTWTVQPSAPRLNRVDFRVS